MLETSGISLSLPHPAIPANRIAAGKRKSAFLAFIIFKTNMVVA